MILVRDIKYTEKYSTVYKEGAMKCSKQRIKQAADMRERGKQMTACCLQEGKHPKQSELRLLRGCVC